MSESMRGDGAGLPDAEARGSTLSDEDLIRRATDFMRRAADHAAAWRREAREAFEFAAGHQWSEEDRATLEQDGRPPITFNRVGPVVDSVTGSQVNNRQDVRYLPRGQEDSRSAEVATQLAEWARQQCEAEDEDSEAFRDLVVAGMGWMAIRMDYAEDPEGRIVLERVDPFEMLWDPGARKKNLVDARELAHERPWLLADVMAEWPDARGELEARSGVGRRGAELPRWHDPRDSYRRDDAPADEAADNRVVVTEYQWAERMPGRLVADPQVGRRVFMPAEQWRRLTERLRQVGIAEPDSIAHTHLVWRRAFFCGDVLLERGECPCPFSPTFFAMTGKRDSAKGRWYGLVRSMTDPQRWSNKFFSQILHILNTSAKSGWWVEDDAVDSIAAMLETAAKPGAVTVLRPGGLAKIQAKASGNYPQGLDRLMQIAISATQDVSGVNKELLGLADRDQPGILEAQRKQSAQALLAPVFDALRRYYKRSGRVLLHYIRAYVPPDRLIRVLGDNGQPQLLQSAMLGDATAYDLIVDEAPSSPNAKSQAWAALQPMFPIMAKLQAPLDVWMLALEQSPLPASVVVSIKEAFERAQQQQAQQQGQQPPEGLLKTQAEIQALQAKTQAGIQAKAQETQAGIQLDQAKAAADFALKRQQQQAQQAADQFAGMLQRGMPGSYPVSW